MHTETLRLRSPDANMPAGGEWALGSGREHLSPNAAIAPEPDFCTDSNDEEMPIGLAMGCEPGEAEIWHTGRSSLRYLYPARAARRVPAIEVFELDGKNGALKSLHPVVEPNLDVMVELKLSMVAQLAQALGDRRVVGDNCATLAERP